SLRKQVRLPPTLFFTLAVPMILAGILFSYGTVIGRDGGTALLAGFFCLKVLELRNRKDFLVIIGVSYALILAALLFSQSLFICTYLIFQFVFTTACLVKIHARSKKPEKKETFRLAGSILLKSLPLALILFVFFPRIDAQLRFSPFDPSSGFADSMSPGSVAGAHTNRRMAFRVEFPDGNIPKPQDLYWRGVILSKTRDGMEWERTAQGVSGPAPRIEEYRDKELPKDWVRQVVSLIPSFQRWVFALDYPVAYPAAGEKHVGGVVGWSYKIRSRLNYEVISHIGHHSRELSPALKRRYLQLPEERHLTKRVRELVSEWKGQSKDEYEMIERALKYFQDEEFAYTFYPGTYRRNALDRFLFDRKRGFCEHFSGSFATLMRMAGIPARVVLGFHGGEMNPYGEFMLVRKQNAHSWVEVWIEDRGWSRVDPTSVVAPIRLEGGFGALQRLIGRGFGFSIAGMEFYLFSPGWMPEPIEAFFNELQNRIDNINRIWDEMLGYDFGTQIQLMNQLGVKESPLAGMVGILLGLSLVIVLVTGFLMLRRKELRLPEDQILSELETKLKRVGLERPRNQGVQTFLVRVGERFPDLMQKIDAFSSVYHNLKFRRNTDEGREVGISKLTEMRNGLLEALAQEKP
ncbi:MAG: DUF3488 and transglutaminase-like domain-containing protein, partial [Verrucomicrobiota bacterium]